MHFASAHPPSNLMTVGFESTLHVCCTSSVLLPPHCRPHVLCAVLKTDRQFLSLACLVVGWLMCSKIGLQARSAEELHHGHLNHGGVQWRQPTSLRLVRHASKTQHNALCDAPASRRGAASALIVCVCVSTLLYYDPHAGDRLQQGCCADIALLVATVCVEKPIGPPGLFVVRTFHSSVSSPTHPCSFAAQTTVCESPQVWCWDAVDISLHRVGCISVALWGRCWHLA